MRTATLFVAWVCFTLSAAAQEKKEVLLGNGDIAKEKRETGSYTKIKVSGPFETELIAGDPGIITLKGDANLLPLITTQVKDGILIIATKDEQPLRCSKNSKITITVPYTNMEAISLKGSGSISVASTIKSDIKISLDGSGSVDLPVSCGSVSAWLLGSGDINVKGKAENFECKVVGSGIIKATGLEAGTVKACISGSGDIEVNSGKAITGRIVGSGTVAFSGNPEKTDLKISGSGEFKAN